MIILTFQCKTTSGAHLDMVYKQVHADKKHKQLAGHCPGQFIKMGYGAYLRRVRALK